MKIGREHLIVDEKDIIHHGQHGTVIFRGKFGDRTVAVKRMLKERHKLAMQEIKILEKSDEHPNIVRYFLTDEDQTYIYLALELYTHNLGHYVQHAGLMEQLKPIQACRQMVEGLHYLHCKCVIHRNIKPSNILLFGPLCNKDIIVKLSDYCISKSYADTGRDSFVSALTLGSATFTSPELACQSTERKTSKVDIYSLGLVIFYTLSGGKTLCLNASNHPTNLNCLETFAQGKLVESMTLRAPDNRPVTHEIRLHPAFWDVPKILDFFTTLSNSKMSKSFLESKKHEVFSNQWSNKLSPVVMEELRAHRCYRTDSLEELVRVIRNLKNHVKEKSKELQEEFTKGGLTTDQGIVKYFLDRFPSLLYTVWQAVKNQRSAPDLITFY